MSNGFSSADMSTAAANGHAEGYQAGYADAVKAVEDASNIIELLLTLAYAAWSLADNADGGSGNDNVSVDRRDFDKVSEALDALDELPDDQPGYVMEAAAKARWALRGIRAAPVAAAPVDSLETTARRMFEQQADPLAAPWDRQWEPTKEHWRNIAANASTTAAPGIDLQERLSRAYSERNALAIAFARAAIAAGWPSGRGFDADAAKDWDDNWRHVIYVDLPNGGQVSWHVSPDEITLLDSLPEYGGEWDGTFVARNPSWCQFDASPKGGSDACIWADDGEGNWHTACGDIFTLMEGSPADNKMHHCPYCGKNLQATSAEVGA